MEGPGAADEGGDGGSPDYHDKAEGQADEEDRVAFEGRGSLCLPATRKALSCLWDEDPDEGDGGTESVLVSGLSDGSLEICGLGKV